VILMFALQAFSAEPEKSHSLQVLTPSGWSMNRLPPRIGEVETGPHPAPIERVELEIDGGGVPRGKAELHPHRAAQILKSESAGRVREHLRDEPGRHAQRGREAPLEQHVERGLRPEAVDWKERSRTGDHRTFCARLGRGHRCAEDDQAHNPHQPRAQPFEREVEPR